MIVFAIVSTVTAIAITVLVFFGNMMNPAPTADNFVGAWIIWSVWAGAVLCWIAWAVEKFT